MVSQLMRIFPDEWQYMVDSYKKYFLQIDGRDFPVNSIINWIEMGILFGQRIYNIGFGWYTEIGCGFGVPSLTIERLGGANITAFDIDLNILEFAEKLKTRCRSNIKFKCMDFNYRSGEGRRDEVWISEKPRSNNDYEDLEIRIVEDAITSGVNIAIVPSPKKNGNQQLSEYNDRCRDIEDRLKSAGYDVDSQIIIQNLPLRWVIGRKNKAIFSSLSN